MKIKFNILSKLIVLFLMFAPTVYSQVTVGINSFFRVRHNSLPFTNFFTVTDPSGQVGIPFTLRLENTTSSNIGVIYKGTDRFLHNYGTDNTFLGDKSGNFAMTGTKNTGVGPISLFSNTIGNYNSALGYQSLFFNISGSENTAVGVNSLFSNTSGESNTAVGVNSLNFNTTGYYNTAVGSYSLYSNTTGRQNTAVGLQSLNSNTTGYYNTAVGMASLYDNTTGIQNTTLGVGSLRYNTTGNQNTALGLNSLYINTSGNDNTAIGFQSLQYNTTGIQNTAVGRDAGSNITTGSNNTVIGYNAQLCNQTSNEVRIGNTSVTFLSTQVPWTTCSDRRWKSNILNSNLGLNFISKLRPVSYTRNNDEKQKTEYGFIAQEVEDVLKESGVDNTGMINIDDKGSYAMRYNDLFSPIVKAIQELKVENDKLKENNGELALSNENLKSEVESLKAMNDKIVKLEKTINEMTSVKHTSLINEVVNSSNSK